VLPSEKKARTIGILLLLGSEGWEKMFSKSCGREDANYPRIPPTTNLLRESKIDKDRQYSSA